VKARVVVETGEQEDEVISTAGMSEQPTGTGDRQETRGHETSGNTGNI